MSNKPLFGFPVGPWIRTFAWLPVWTFDAGRVWLRPCWKRHIQKHNYLPGPKEFWWQYQRFQMCTDTYDGRRIVCAANRKTSTGKVVLGLRHWDVFMSRYLFDSQGDPVDQGFIDNMGNFLSRTEAWVVAGNAGQIIKRVGGDTADGGTLYSENLY